MLFCIWIDSLYSLIGIVIVVVVVILGLGFYWFSQKQPQKYTGPVEKITLATYAGGYGFIPYIAQEKGYFAENRLEVTVNDYEIGLKATEALISDKADVATGAEFVFVTMSFDRSDLRILSSIATSEVNEVIAREDRGIRTPGDLKGKRIGFTPKTKAEFFLGRWLVYNGVKFSDIKPVHIPSPKLKEALISGEVDAVAAWEPFVRGIKEQMGGKIISWPTQSGQEFYYLLISKEKWLKDHPQAARRLVKSLIQAEDFIRNSPTAAQKIIEKRFGYEPSFAQYLWGKNKFIVDLSQALLLTMEDGARWRIKNGLTDKKTVPNYLNYIYFDALEAVKPEAVTVIR